MVEQSPWRCYLNKPLRYRVIIEIPTYEKEDEIDEWILENMAKGGWQKSNLSCLRFHNDTMYLEYEYSFKKEADAMYFALRWK